MSTLQLIVLLFGSGGSISALITGFVLWKKSGAEKERVVVGAAGDVVIMQGNVMRFLYSEVERLQKRNEELEALIAKIDKRRVTTELDAEPPTGI